MAHTEMEIVCEFYDNVLDTMESINAKIKNGEAKMRPEDSGYIKNLSESAMSLTTTIAMIERSQEDRSEDYRGDMRSYDDAPIMHRASGAGRRNARRDSMGRYSREEEMRSMSDNVRRRLRDNPDMPEDVRKSAEDLVSRLDRRM